MLDIKWIKHNAHRFDEDLKSRGIYSEEVFGHGYGQEIAQILPKILQEDIEHINSSILINIYDQKCLLKKNIDNFKFKLNKYDKSTPEAYQLKETLQREKEKYMHHTQALDKLLQHCPNILDVNTPSNNKLIKESNFLKEAKIPHYETKMGINVRDGVSISGKRFVLLEKGAALLERALINFMLDTHRKNGYEEISVPYIVRSESLFHSGQLPKFYQDAFILEGEKWLIPTGEVALVNMVQNKLLNKKDLPLKFVTHSDCFRSEAGAAGRDTKGLVRLHQFKKVELVQIIDPEHSQSAMREILKSAESILQLLKLPYRIISIGADDIGFTAAQQFDLEVWMPGMNKYVEISSCSLCYDFQSRRMNTKIKENKVFPYTLNGSALAIGRTLAAIIENYQVSTNKCFIPEVLSPYIKLAISSEKELEKFGLAFIKS